MSKVYTCKCGHEDDLQYPEDSICDACGSTGKWIENEVTVEVEVSFTEYFTVAVTVNDKDDIDAIHDEAFKKLAEAGDKHEQYYTGCEESAYII